MLNLQTHFEDAVKGWKERLSCSAPGCRGPRKLWGRISNTSGSAQIHGQRYCLLLCFERELHRRLLELRVSGERRPRPPHRVPLGLLMLSRGELNHAQLREVLDVQKQNGGGRIGEWIQKLGYA